MADLLVVLCTVPSEAVAERIATGLVEARLAACVNVIPSVRSFYMWKGALERDDELQLVIKTRADRFAEVSEWITREHPYDVPEILSLPVAQASRAYGDWVEAQARDPSS